MAVLVISILVLYSDQYIILPFIKTIRAFVDRQPSVHRVVVCLVRLANCSLLLLYLATTLLSLHLFSISALHTHLSYTSILYNYPIYLHYTSTFHIHLTYLYYTHPSYTSTLHLPHTQSRHRYGSSALDYLDRVGTHGT